MTHTTYQAAIAAAKREATQTGNARVVVQSRIGTRNWKWYVDAPGCFLREGEDITHAVQPNGHVTRLAARIETN